MKIDFADKTVGGFNYELLRALSAADAGAAELGECLATAERITHDDFDSWISEWKATGDRVSAYAQEEKSAGNPGAARDAFRRASNYYRVAVFYAAHADPRHRELWKRSKECFDNMAKLMTVSPEAIAIEFEGKKLPAYFVSGGEGARPTLIALGGFDSTMEEVYFWIGDAAARRGWNCLVFEGPGQWGALMTNPGLYFRPDYEKPVAAVVDYLLTRSDVDKDKIALIGYSMGGYLAMRGALDPRIKACIPNTLVVDPEAAAKAGMKGMVKHEILTDVLFKLVAKRNVAARWGFQHSQWVLGIRSAHEWVQAYQGYRVRGFEARYTNPLLFLFGEDDIRDAAAPSPAIVEELVDFMLELKCPRFIRLFSREEGASSHCQMGGLSYARSTIFDWLDCVLRGIGTPRTADTASASKFVELFGRYGGKASAAKARQLVSGVPMIV